VRSKMAAKQSSRSACDRTRARAGGPRNSRRDAGATMESNQRSAVSLRQIPIPHLSKEGRYGATHFVLEPYC
jgi:hypothetical protein